jgi:anti-sigma regulatory factor (Ser/Thr protein kinase)
MDSANPQHGPPGGTHPRQPSAAATYELPASTSSARLARELVRRTLSGFDRPIVEIAELLVSELVANAVAHAHSAPVMRIDVTGDAVRVAVQDASPGPVEVRDAPLDAPNGRGLLLVDSLAASWGWAPTPEGKRVWFTL